MLTLWVKSVRPYINIIDNWVCCGCLNDPCREFFVLRFANYVCCRLSRLAVIDFVQQLIYLLVGCYLTALLIQKGFVMHIASSLLKFYFVNKIRTYFDYGNLLQ